jgi:predicted regulator of Ras-like GTPase activity (Roadblock/LC7/MglB family)
MSSLMGLIESFGREALNSGALYTSISTEHGSIVMVRILSERRQHMLCVCADATENLGMAIRAARDTAQTLAQNIDAGP